MTIEEFRSELEELKKDWHPWQGYPDRLKSFAVGYAKQKMSEGCALSRVMTELGMGRATWHTWLQAVELPRRRDQPRLERVQIRQDTPRGTLKAATEVVVMAPRGIRIEGL